ncbi:hypothetical protein [Sphingomonas jatrophae]|uniref:Uncharacterized protein n=1 Tax=Sphingomonas jatrophae TaxID=1166337 RepID=A0A1I6KYK2_9SPHN|nr:hypothetical protein [Sphingomonas jatrophae]SFR96267.1 hypothetical protein SAMN05192580_1963 [Sphingomonas jatrophae]
MQQDPQSFVRERASPAPASLDWPRLLAALTAYQASTRTAQVAMRVAGLDRPADAAAGALADIVEGRRGWTAAAASLGGRFRAEPPLGRGPQS